MEQVPETGGPVYPGKAMDVFEMNERGQLQMAYSSGITLRDHFAGLAMQNVFMTGGDDSERDYIADHAYKMADAMLKARK